MEWRRLGHESRGLVRRSVFILRLTEYTARCLPLLLFVLCLPIVISRAQVVATHTEPAMQCADTSKRDSGDVVVTNACDFKITVQASIPGGTQMVRSLDPGGSGSIAASAHNPWRVFACTWPGTPAEQNTGKEVAYATVKYECDVQTASPQVQQSLSQPSDEIKAAMAKLYADAHPYMNEPLPELKKDVRELAGLKPAPSQGQPSDGQPSDLLAKIGAKADELLQKVPDLISDESVSQVQYAASQGIAPGCSGTECLATGRGSGFDQGFSYLILTHPAPDGRLVLQEYRTSKKGKPVQGAGAPNFQGFISSWIVFSSPNQVESHYRYLGQQQTDGHNTFVVGFAQIPGSVASPGIILSDRESVPMLFQGIAWVDQSDFRIVRLRTDLLAPQPEISVQKQTANILFGPVQIPTLSITLWLPRAVQVEMETRDQILREEHKYSKYRLYQAKSKLVLSPKN
jgi:hypothetical protein